MVTKKWFVVIVILLCAIYGNAKGNWSTTELFLFLIVSFVIHIYLRLK